MAKGFVFIDGTRSDRSTKRVARSHAMKEKNLGKTHQRGLKPAQSKICLSKSRGQAVGRAIAASICGSAESPASLFIYQSLPSPPLSVDATPWSLEVIKTYFTSVVGAVYPSRLCISLDRIKSYWIRIMFLDQTSYHCSLALMAILNSFVFGREPVPLEATYHLSQAVGLVNEKLGTAEALSNSNLAVVNFLIIRDIFKEDEASARIHWQGLQKMVALRGGLSMVEDRTLALKIAKTDIDFALHYGTSPAFFRDRMSQAVKELGMTRPVGCRSFCALYSTETDPSLRQIISNFNELAAWFNEDKSCDADPDALQEIIVSVGYRLVQFHALSGPPLESNVSSVYHIGLVAFLTTLFLQSGSRRFLRYSLVAQRLRDIVERGLDDEDKRPVLWLLLIGGISVLEEADQPWLLRRISETAQLLNIESWSELQHLLHRFPWIYHMHDGPSQHLWKLAMTT